MIKSDIKRKNMSRKPCKIKGLRKNNKKIKKVLKKVLTFPGVHYIIPNVPRKWWPKCVTGCGSAWLERLVWDQEVAGSNPVTPIFFRLKGRKEQTCAGVVQW